MKKALLISLAALVASPVFAKDRIVSAGYGVTEILFALEAQDEIVAADFTSRNLIAGSDIEQLGVHVQLNAEGLIALNPTHLVGTSEMGPPTTIEQVKHAGVEVITMPSGQSSEELLARIETLGVVTQKQAQAEALKLQVQKNINELQAKACADKPKAVFLMLDLGGVTRIAGSNTAIDYIIELAGAKNAATDSVEGYKTISMESLLEMQPDYLMVSQRAWDKYQSVDKILASMPVLALTPAGKEKRVVVIPTGALLGGFGLGSIEVANELNQSFCAK